MSAAGGPWTRHGHDIPGVTVAGGMPPAIARCGGPALCRQCREDVQAHAGRDAGWGEDDWDEASDADRRQALDAALRDRDRLADEVGNLRAQRGAVLALAAEWEKEGNARQPLTLMGYEIHEMNGEQATCRSHAREVREALGEDR